ncbi:hypothetical protein JKY72_03695 [Candidatus Gracilibacteria bacterium]|nr:hypothetical protein [Candidatus Gracilibacteria bacterium]
MKNKKRGLLSRIAPMHLLLVVLGVALAFAGCSSADTDNLQTNVLVATDVPEHFDDFGGNPPPNDGGAHVDPAPVYDPAADCSSTGGSWDGSICQFYMACPDGSQVIAPAVCPEVMISCPDGSQVNEGSSCPVVDQTAPTNSDPYYSTAEGSCSTSGGYWNYSGNFCDYNSTDNYGYTNDDTYHNPGDYDNYTAPTVGDCDAAGGTWNASGSWCDYSSSTSTYEYHNGSGDFNDPNSCDAAGFFWDFNTSYCNSGDASTYNAPYNDYPVPTVGECDSAGGTWHAEGSWCEYNYGAPYDNYDPANDPYNNYPVPTVGECDAAGGTWHAQGSWCDYNYGAPYDNYDPANDPYNDGRYEDDRFRDDGFADDRYYDPSVDPYADYDRFDDRFYDDKYYEAQYDTHFADTQCGRDEFFDYAFQACQPMFRADDHFGDDYFDTFTHDSFECPEWDYWCKENQGNDGGFNDDFFGTDDFFGDSQCLDEREAKRQKFEIKQQIDEFERQFNYIEFDQASDLAVVGQASNLVSELKNIDLDDACALGRAWDGLSKIHDQGGIQEQLNNVQEITNFRRELDFVIQDATRELSYVDSTKAKGLLGRAIARAEELKANPPVNASEPWKIWESLDPECMRIPQFGVSGVGIGFESDFGSFGPSASPTPGGGFGGGDFGCTIEELISSNTPRGYLDAAFRTQDDERYEHFEANICADAGQKIAAFADFIVPELTGASQAEGRDLVAKGERLLAKCESSQDKFKIMEHFEKLGQKAERLMSQTDVDLRAIGLEDDHDYDYDYDDDFGGFDDFNSFGDFGGVDSLMGSDLAAKIEALVNARVEEALSAATAKFEEMFISRLAEVAHAIDEKILAKVTSILAVVTDEIKEGISRNIEFVTILPIEAQAIANQAIETNTEIIEKLETIKASNPDLERKIEQVQAIVTERPLPVAVLAEIDSITSQAETASRNGLDPETELDAIRDFMAGLSDDEINRLAASEGTQSFVDVTPGKVWYDIVAQEAATLGVVNGTTGEDGFKELQPGKVLNAIEGLAMMGNAAEINEVPASEEVRRLVGDAAWAADRVQGIANAIGFDKVESLILESGGAGGAMPRNVFADGAIALFESEAGSITADTSRISYFSDYGDMDDDERHDFAIAHEMGMITGADGGTRANFDGEANRAEAAEMLTSLQENIESFDLTGDFVGE